MTKELWYQKTSTVFNGILVFSIANIAHSVLELFSLAEGGKSEFSVFFLQLGLTPSQIDRMAKFDIFAIIAIILGGLLLFKGLRDFAVILSGRDSAHVKNLRNGVVVSIIAAALCFIPDVTGSIISGIVYFVAIILMLIAYMALKNSLSFPPQAAKGAGTLFISQILLLVGIIIPVMGIIISVIGYILMLAGWSTIRNADSENGI